MLFCLLPALLLALPNSAAAASVTIDGIRFSEGSANMRLVGVSGRGTLEEPFVVREEIVGSGEAVLRIGVESAEFGNRLRTQHAVGFALRKEVINGTDEPWDHFAMELEFVAGQGSDYYDGLSFAQATRVNRPFRSDRFRKVEDMAEPRDMVRFSEGMVTPGQAAVFLVSITHTGPQPTFFLVQHVRRPVARHGPDLWMAVGADLFARRSRARRH